MQRRNNPRAGIDGIPNALGEAFLEDEDDDEDDYDHAGAPLLAPALQRRQRHALNDPGLDPVNIELQCLIGDLKNGLELSVRATCRFPGRSAEFSSCASVRSCCTCAAQFSAESTNLISSPATSVIAFFSKG